MGSNDFDELMEARNECAAAEALAAALERKLRNVVRHGVRGNCPPGRGCARGGSRNCETCWLEWLGLTPVPSGEREREREREDSEEQMI